MVETLPITREFLIKTYQFDDKDINFLNKYKFLWDEKANNSIFINSPMKDFGSTDKYNFRDVIIQRKRNVNVTPLMLADLIFRLKFNKNFVILAYSDTGIGKSYHFIMLSLIVKDYVNMRFKPDYDIFNADNIVFNIDEYLELSEKVKRYSILMNDEENPERFGVGSYTNNINYERFQDLMRSQQFNHISCSPSMREFLAYHYAVELIGISYDNGLSGSIWLNNNRFIPNPFGLVVLPNPELYEPDLMKLYEKKKKTNQELFLNKGLGFAKRRKWLEIGADIIKRYQYLSYKNKIHKKTIMLNLNTAYPQAFGIREQEIIIELIDAFLTKKPIEADDKAYINKLLEEK